MTTCKNIMKRNQKYYGIHLFLVLDKNWKKLNDDLEEEEKKVTQNTSNSNYRNSGNYLSLPLGRTNSET